MAGGCEHGNNLGDTQKAENILTIRRLLVSEKNKL
jgi:hypothetical protein